MENELISVVLTSYNHKEYLEQAITHILCQTYENIELIIVDDCSTDGSQEIIKSYANNPKVKIYLLEKNLGSYVKTTNLGASYASGMYLNFAQCDDYSDRFLLEKLYNALKHHPQCGVAYSGSYMVDENDVIIGDDYHIRSARFKKKIFSSTLIKGEVFRTLLYESCVIPNLSAVLVRKAIYQKVGGLSTDFLVLADWDMWIRISYHTDFFYVNEKLNYFRQHSETIRNRISVKKQLDELIQMYLYNKRNNKVSCRENLFICYNAVTIIVSFIRISADKSSVAFYAIWSSLKYSPLIIVLFPFSLIRKIISIVLKNAKHKL